MDFKERYQYNPETDLLGSGGFGQVYLATDKLLDRQVAIKFFTGETGDKYSVIAEIRKVIELQHENITRYYDAVILETANVHGGTDKVEVGIMEFMDGGELKDYVNKHKNEPELVDKLLIDVLKGLEYLHEHEIIHRDMKPQNVLIKNTKKGPVAKIMDFGISKEMDGTQASSSAILGSIEYMAPEQFNPAKYGRNGKISTHVDLWSFGICVTELLNDDLVFGSRSTGVTSEQVMSNILNLDVEEEVSKLREPWQSVARACLVRDANERADSAADLLKIIESGGAALPAKDEKVEFIKETEVAKEPVNEDPVDNEPKPTAEGTVKTEVFKKEKSQPETNTHEETKTENMELSVNAPMEGAKKRSSKIPLIIATSVAFASIIGFLLFFGSSSTDETGIEHGIFDQANEGTSITNVGTNGGTGDQNERVSIADQKITPQYVAVKPSKMNVLYIGVDNPISISTSGIPSDRIKLSMTSGSLKPGNRDGEYSAKVSKPGTVAITVSTSDKGSTGIELWREEFRVKRVPPPIAKIANQSGGNIKSETFKAQQGMIASLENFDFEFKYKIISYEVSYLASCQTMRAREPGPIFSDKVRGWVRGTKAGDFFYFDNIKAKGQDGSTRKLPAIAFNII